MAVTKAGRVAELLGRRTLHGKVFGLDDGSLQVELYGRPIHYRDADNLWQDIDLTAVDDVSVPEFDAVYKECYTPVRFSKSSKRPWRLRFSQDQWIIYRACDGQNSHAIISGPIVLYADAWDSADLRYTVLGHGVKEEIILKGPPAPTSYAFDVETHGVDLQSDGAGSYQIIGSGGGIVAILPAPSVRDAVGAVGATQLTWDINTKRLTIAVDPLWLMSPARIWPVVLDPTTIQPNAADGKDTYVGEGIPDTNRGTVDPLRIGCEAAGVGNDNRALLEFTNALLEPYDDYNATVATADLYCRAELNATDRIVGVFGVLVAWGEMTATWNNQPTHATAATDSKNITGTGAWFSWNVVSLVQNWLYTPTSNMGMKFISQSEDVASSRKDFDSSDSAAPNMYPRLVITLNARPTATPTSPLGTLVAPGTVIDDVSPTFTWTYADAEANAQVGLQVRIYTDAGALVYDSGDVTSAVASRTIPANTLDYDTLYKWQVRVRDASGWSFWSGLQWFECLYSAPTGLRANNLFSANQADVEINTVGFIPCYGTGISRSADWAQHGSYSLKVVTPGVATYEGVYVNDTVVIPGTLYSAHLYIYGTGGTVRVWLKFRSADGGTTSDVGMINITPGVVAQQATCSGIVPAWAATVRFYAAVPTIQAITYYIDAICLGATGLTHIDLTWDAHLGEDLAGYHIYRKKNTGATYSLLTSAIITTTSYTDYACGSGLLYNYKVTPLSNDGYEGPQSLTSVQEEVGVTFSKWRLGTEEIKLRSGSLSWPVLSDKIQLPGIDLPLVVPTRTGVLGDSLMVEVLATTAIKRDALKTIWATNTPLSLRSPDGDVWIILPVDELNVRMIPTGSGFLYTFTGTLQEVAP